MYQAEDLVPSYECEMDSATGVFECVWSGGYVVVTPKDIAFLNCRLDRDISGEVVTAADGTLYVSFKTLSFGVEDSVSVLNYVDGEMHVSLSPTQVGDIFGIQVNQGVVGKETISVPLSMLSGSRVESGRSFLDPLLIPVLLMVAIGLQWKRQRSRRKPLN